MHYPLIHMYYIWKVYKVSCDSDHFPIIVENFVPNEGDLHHWKLKGADWEKYTEFKKSLIQDIITEHLTTHFTETLIAIETLGMAERQTAG